MSKTPVCVNPVIAKNIKVGQELRGLVDPEAMAPYVNEVRPFILEVDLLYKCAGSCLYCYSQSTSERTEIMPKEKAFNLIDQAAECGVKQLSWCGGDPLLHPDWVEIVSYCAEKGMMNMMGTSTLISKRQAEQLCSLEDKISFMGVHLSTINPKNYALVYSDPKTLELKMQGVRNLIEAGYPPERIWNVMTLTRPVLEDFEETVDWFVDKLGIKNICTILYRWIKALQPLNPEWEPSSQELRKAYEYRAKKLGSDWLRLGTSEGSLFFCRTTFGVKVDGTAVPCVGLYELPQGNIFEEGLKTVIEKYGDTLLFNFKVKGYCGDSCENRDLCFGCRWTSWHYTGDIQASDPKCWLNPENQEYVF